MQSYEIGPNEAGQRFDKFLHKYMPEAGTSFFYKMLRKKNITLNGKKAEGREILHPGDKVCFFFAQETFEKFRGISDSASGLKVSGKSVNLAHIKNYEEAYENLRGIQVLYEDEHVLILNKPAGVLTQKAQQSDLSLNEWLIGYLLKEGKITEKVLETFKPSVCNRLDRNTGGIVLCGKTLVGSQELGRLIKERKLGKFYRTFVKGQMGEKARITGNLVKDERTNKVTVVNDKNKAVKASDAQPIETAYEPLSCLKDMTYLEVELITGKTHQIRAHLASVGHPLGGDGKYGNPGFNERLRKEFGVKWQLLHAYRMEFPVLDGPLSALSEKVIIAPLPPIFEKILQSRN